MAWMQQDVGFMYNVDMSWKSRAIDIFDMFHYSLHRLKALKHEVELQHKKVMNELMSEK